MWGKIHEKLQEEGEKTEHKKTDVNERNVRKYLFIIAFFIHSQFLQSLPQGKKIYRL